MSATFSNIAETAFLVVSVYGNVLVCRDIFGSYRHRRPIATIDMIASLAALFLTMSYLLKQAIEVWIS